MICEELRNGLEMFGTFMLYTFVEFSQESAIEIALSVMVDGDLFKLMFMILLGNYCQVDYQEKQYAQGLIPNTYMRREGAPKERELLCGRLIDRPIRPLFPTGFYHEVQV